MSVKKHIPNAITSMNLLSGVLGVIVSLEGHVETGFLLMLAAGGFDFLDGFAARLLKVTSEIGKELDSLSDLVSFGVLPAVMMYEVMAMGGIGWPRFLVLVLPVFSGLRLAKFNTDSRQSSSFIGLPTPAAALLSGSLALFLLKSGALSAGLLSIVLPLVAAVLSALEVSEIPMFSMKIKKGGALFDIKRTVFFSVSAIMVIITVMLNLHWSVALVLIFGFYILENLLFALAPNSSPNEP